MGRGAIALALVLLIAGAGPADLDPMNIRGFKIPITLNAGQKDKIKELLLFTSTDEGKTWNQAAVATPDKDGFVFYAPSDGVYWFNVAVVDQQGNRSPKDIYTRQPDRKILIDTVKPTVRIVSAERVQDEVQVAWDIQEDHPDLATLKIEYRTSDSANWMWYTAQAIGSLKGQTRFRLATPGSVVVRVQLTDQAGNTGMDEKEIKPIGAGPGPVAPVMQSLPPNPVAVQNPALTGTANNGNPNTFQQPAAWNGAAPGWGQQTIQPAAMPANPYPAPPAAPWMPAQTPRYPQDTGYSSSNNVTPTSYYGAPPVPRWPNGVVLPLQITNQTQVSLNYHINNEGPSGIGAVELYITQDDGRTWQRHHVLQPEPGNSTMRPPMVVSLPGEGIHGLRLVVRSRAGLGKRPPQSGDLPQMKIEVDTTRPVVKMFYPQMDSNRRDAIVLTWSATDRNLAPSPISLQYSDGPRGPWRNIATDVANTGRYIWQPPATLSKVYLRVAAQDTAGNIGEDITPEAVLVDLNEPEGQLIGISGTSPNP
jgi:hypothetical protein